MHFCRSWLTAAVATAVAASPAPAGPDIVEDCTGDAGSFPGTALPARGPGPTVNTLQGCLSSVLPLAGPPDLEDMYLINIVDPQAFHASTVFGDPSGRDTTTFDAQLWLFSGPDQPQPVGRGLLGNQQANDGLPPGSAALGNASNDGTGVVVDEPGLYYLAISEVFNVPQSGPLDIFQFTLPFEVSGPDGPGGDGPVDRWSGESAGRGGTYVIFLDGVAPVPPAPGDTNGDDVVNVDDLNNVILDWGTGGADHGGDVAGPAPDDGPDGVVDVNDLNAVIVNWTT